MADLRAEEARIHFARGKQQGAYYLAGYAVECAPKACIAKKTKRFQFPPKQEEAGTIYSHRVEELLVLAGLEEPHKKEMKSNPSFLNRFNAGESSSVKKKNPGSLGATSRGGGTS